MNFCFWEWETKIFPRDSIIKAINKTSLSELLGCSDCVAVLWRSGSELEAGSPGEAGEVSKSENILLLLPRVALTSDQDTRIMSNFSSMEDDQRWLL